MRAIAVCFAFGLGLGLGLGCKAMPPPPLIPMHTDTSAAPLGSTTAMLILGLYSQFLFGGDGIGVAVRVERQETTRTAVGLELGGGRGEVDRPGMRPPGGRVTHWLIAARAYGKLTPREHDFVALTYGGGLSVMDTGLVALTLHGGGAISHPNRYLVPVAAMGLAASIPILRGGPIVEDAALAGPPILRTPDYLQELERARAEGYPKADLFPYLDLGLVVPIGETGNRLSIDLGFAPALRSDTSVLTLSIGDAHRFDAP